MKRWYGDRDFPEIKAGNDDIVAVVINTEQRRRLTDTHNEMVFVLERAERLISYYLHNDAIDNRARELAIWLEDYRKLK